MLHIPDVAAPIGEVLVLGLPGHAFAYIGPGAGLGGLAVLVALSLGVLLLVIGLVWYPLKRVLRGRTKEAAGGTRTDESE